MRLKAKSSELPRSAAFDAAAEKTKVFVSYSRKDRGLVGRLVEALEAVESIQVFRDTADILPTEEWRERLEKLIGAADTVIFCLSPNSATSEICAWEVKVSERLNKRIVPIVLQDVDGKVPGRLAELNYIFCTHRDDFDRAFGSFVTSLQTDISWIREHTRIGELSWHWEQGGKSDDQLLRGAELGTVEVWMTGRPRNAPLLTEHMHAFIHASQDREIGAKRRRRLARAAIVALLGLIAAGWATQDRWVRRADVWANRVLNLATDVSTPGRTFQECSFCPEMVIIPAGSIIIGSAEHEEDRDEGEGQRQVTVPNAIAVSRFEVTFEEWDVCSASRGCDQLPPDEGWGHGRQPVINVSWADADQYVKWLTRLTRQQYGLLSDAEWEYAARAGSRTRYSWGETVGRTVANCNVCGWQGDKSLRGATAPVGTFKPNGFGLYDMHGNAREWVKGCFAIRPLREVEPHSPSGLCTNEIRVLRGGSWNDGYAAMRSAARWQADFDDRRSDYGFRVTRAVTR